MKDDFWARGEKNTPLFPMKEIDYKALRLMLERSDGPNLVKKRHLNKFDRAWKRGQLFYCKEETQMQKWMRCEARFCLGDYTDWSGWQYRDRWAEKIWFQNPFLAPVWNTQYVGKLYVIGEQGLGDEILLSQCVEEARGKVGEVVIETQKRLQSIFERSFNLKTIPAIVGADTIRRAQPFEADAWVSLGDLPRLFRRKKQDFPRRAYIRPDEHRVMEMEQYRGRVGISWRGAQGRIDWRKLLQRFPTAISLQYDQSEEEEVERPHFNLKEDLEGVLALAAVLEKVVTVSTTSAHICASSGVDMDLIIADRGTGIRNSILPWRWLDLSCPVIPRKAMWYGDNVRVWHSWGEYVAYNN